MNCYESFLASKSAAHGAFGLNSVQVDDLHPLLFDWQKVVVRWALRKGRACLFQDCGLGKTFQQLEWARHIPGNVLILSPLAVAEQTAAEGRRWGYEAAVSRSGSVAAPITVTNYQQLSKFDPGDFAGVVVDESSILKAFDGKTRREISDFATSIEYRLACTATPAPNDCMELGTHAEFVGAMSQPEMLARFFVHDGGETQKWRLKGHAVGEFWSWVATWACMVRTPGDIGYSNDGYLLPSLEIVEHVIETESVQEGELFTLPALTLSEQRNARRETLESRCQRVAELVNDSSGIPWVVWCELNDEAALLESLIPGSVQVSGADSDETKADRLNGFSRGEFRVLVTKPKIAGFGMNWQHCAHQAFVGLSHSWEQFYQSVRRSYRFGQSSPVKIHVVSTDREIAVLQNVKRKQEGADEMAAAMVEAMKSTMMEEIHGRMERETGSAGIEGLAECHDWELFHGDCVEVLSGLDEGSIDYSVFSPPFASLYTYTDSDRDMGNCSDSEEFIEHLRFMAEQLFRVIRPGRLFSFHCMLLPTSKARDGVIGLSDFRGDLIRLFRECGFVHHSEVVIWKDPVTAMQRTKALGLLHKTIRKDSSMSRQGIPDYLVTMRKPGENAEPISHEAGTGTEFPVEVWQQYASPVWTDINPSDTLQFRSAREHDDERHICPLQLTVIRRAIKMWSNPGDLVLSPFAGIGSEGVVALEEGRRFVGAELKKSYFDQAAANLRNARSQPSLFSLSEFTGGSALSGAGAA